MNNKEVSAESSIATPPALVAVVRLVYAVPLFALPRLFQLPVCF